MKKILLVVLLAFSLYGSDFMCNDAFLRAVQHHEAYNFAHERNDIRVMKVENKMEIYYAEKALTRCGVNWSQREKFLKWRKDLIRVSKRLNEL